MTDDNKPNNVRFISTYVNYGNEESNRKRNHIVPICSIGRSRLKRLRDFRDKGIPCDFTNQKGYTKECFTVPITDFTEWRGVGIISW